MKSPAVPSGDGVHQHPDQQMELAPLHQIQRPLHPECPGKAERVLTSMADAEPIFVIRTNRREKTAVPCAAILRGQQPMTCWRTGMGNVSSREMHAPSQRWVMSGAYLAINAAGFPDFCAA